MGLRPNTTLAVDTFPTMKSDPIVRGVLAFNTPGVVIGTFNYRFCRVPAGAEILAAKIKTPTAWAGGGLTAGTLSMGTTAGSFIDIIAATSVFAAGGTLAMAAGAAALEFLVDTDIFLQLILTTGTGPLAGLTRAILDYSAPLQGTNAPFTQPSFGGVPLTPVPV